MLLSFLCDSALGSSCLTLIEGILKFAWPICRVAFCHVVCPLLVVFEGGTRLATIVEQANVWLEVLVYMAPSPS